MRLFIGNATKQVHRFCYRVPEVRGFRYRDIQVGQQICLDDKELNKPVVDSIIDHQARYGFVSVSELDRVKDRYIGLIYSIDKAIPPIKMARMVDHNDGVMVEKGKANRTRAGIAASNEAAKFVTANRPANSIPNFEITVEEDRRDSRDDTPYVRDGHKITRDPSETSRPIAARRGRRRVA